MKPRGARDQKPSRASRASRCAARCGRGRPGPVTTRFGVHSRCDLACDHCYVYEDADQSWHDRPMAIPADVVSCTATRIAEHVKTHELSRVEVVLHGGEPHLAGVAGLRAILAGHGVGVGISLDGDWTANDRHRKYRDGRSSYDAVVRGIRLLASDRYQHLYSGCCARSTPLTTRPSAGGPAAAPRDLGCAAPADGVTGTEYADWLIFDRWQADGYPVRIRTFDSIITTLARRRQRYRSARARSGQYGCHRNRRPLRAGRLAQGRLRRGAVDEPQLALAAAGCTRTGTSPDRPFKLIGHIRDRRPHVAAAAEMHSPNDQRGLSDHPTLPTWCTAPRSPQPVGSAPP